MINRNIKERKQSNSNNCNINNNQVNTTFNNISKSKEQCQSLETINSLSSNINNNNKNSTNINITNITNITNNNNNYHLNVNSEVMPNVVSSKSPYITTTKINRIESINNNINYTINADFENKFFDKSTSTLVTPHFGDNIINYYESNDEKDIGSSNLNSNSEYKANQYNSNLFNKYQSNASSPMYISNSNHIIHNDYAKPDVNNNYIKIISNNSKENSNNSNGSKTRNSNNNNENVQKETESSSNLYSSNTNTNTNINSESANNDSTSIVSLIQLLLKPITSIGNFINPFDNIINPAIKILKEEGIGGLYRGSLSSVICSMVQNGSHFTFVKIFEMLLSDKLSSLFSNNNSNSKSIYSVIILNFLAAIITATITNPIEVIHTRMATLSKKPINLKGLSNISIIKKIFNKEGFAGFFKGIGPSLILTLYPVIQFTVYDYLKGIFEKKNLYVSGISELSSSQIILVSLLSKCITTIINYPLITIKSLSQYNKDSKKSVYDIIKQLIKDAGISGFYSGISNKLISSQISNMILMVIYEKIQAFVRFAVFSMVFGFKINFKKVKS